MLLMALYHFRTLLQFDYEMTWVHTGFSLSHCIGYYIAPVFLLLRPTPLNQGLIDS